MFLINQWRKANELEKMCEGCEVPIHRTGKPVVNKDISFIRKKGGLGSNAMPSLTSLVDWQKLQVWPTEIGWGHGVMGTAMHCLSEQ